MSSRRSYILPRQVTDPVVLGTPSFLLGRLLSSITSIHARPDLCARQQERVHIWQFLPRQGALRPPGAASTGDMGASTHLAHCRRSSLSICFRAWPAVVAWSFCLRQKSLEISCVHFFVWNLVSIPHSGSCLLQYPCCEYVLCAPPST